MNAISNQNHFFASNAGTWMITGPDRDLKQLLRAMDREGLPYNLYFVPLPFDAEYNIKGYMPSDLVTGRLLKGAALVGQFTPKSK